jgi:hypothetical protein
MYNKVRLFAPIAEQPSINRNGPQRTLKQPAVKGSFEPILLDAANHTYGLEGREAAIRCTLHGSLLCGSNRLLAAVTRLTAFGKMY